MLVALMNGCGGHRESAEPRARSIDPEAVEEAMSPRAVERCLRAAGFRTTRGRPAPDDTNAPDVEVTASKPGMMSFIAFYDDARRAKRLEPGIRKNATRFAGHVERHGAVTVVAGSPQGDSKPPTSEALRPLKRCAFSMT
jgi:hypothetical protein